MEVAQHVAALLCTSGTEVYLPNIAVPNRGGSIDIIRDQYVPESSPSI